MQNQSTQRDTSSKAIRPAKPDVPWQPITLVAGYRLRALNPSHSNGVREFPKMSSSNSE